MLFLSCKSSNANITYYVLVANKRWDASYGRKAMSKLVEIESYGMDTKEASKFIGCSAYTIRELAREKKISHYRIGNRIMFTKDTLIKWINKQEDRNWRY
jgi:excisionase family DNA binding protein